MVACAAAVSVPWPWWGPTVMIRYRLPARNAVGLVRSRGRRRSGLVGGGWWPWASALGPVVVQDLARSSLPRPGWIGLFGRHEPAGALLPRGRPGERESEKALLKAGLGPWHCLTGSGGPPAAQSNHPRDGRRWPPSSYRAAGRRREGRHGAVNSLSCGTLADGADPAAATLAEAGAGT